VWAVDEEMLAKLDIFEGCPIYYEVRPCIGQRLDSFSCQPHTSSSPSSPSFPCSLPHQRLATEVERLEEPGAKATGEYIECFAYFKKTIEPAFDELVAIPEYHPGACVGVGQS
jgi:hypothetical protein